MTTAMIHAGGSMLPDANETERYWKLAQRVASTDMVPSQYRGKADAVLAVAIAGRELGLAPMEALRSFDVIDGKPAPSAQLCHTLALRAGHDIAVVETTTERAVVRCRRAEWPADRHVDIDFTKADADAAGLLGKSNWKKYRRAMLRNRAITEAIRAVCPDVLVGATYTAEELGDENTGPDGRTDDGQWVDHIAEVEVVPEALTRDQVTPADDDVVDAELVDDEPTDDDVAAEVEVEPAVAQRADEFDTVLGGYSEEFVDWLDSTGRLDKAREVAAASDEGLGKAEQRLAELHQWWTAQEDEPSW